MGEVIQLALTDLQTILIWPFLIQGILGDTLGTQSKGEAGEGADRDQSAERMEMVALQIQTDPC